MAISLNVSHPIDAKDRQILDLVQRDAKLAQAEIARRVGLSTASVNERLRKLEAASLIRRYVALVDPRGVGVSVTAFVEVFIEHPRFESGFIDQVRKLHEVQECHHITGEFSLLLKIRVRDMESLQHLLIHRLNALEGVRQTRTVVVLSTSKEECYVPTGATGEPT
ncbi:MAG: Lrp/AsnC family transcriptional regulator [Candidatus Eisenbacteria bacterium]|uniref:Lrp/AsnC family transcriptional regulator n=1 Tax=Eiseniibacteriota bacterium TaxID=2212470 RepID=A0A538TFQ4_UNCEI|nr:MAG: Lrp/AsnC family transcriptional regulator [Candidatus Eisenbacteria bacterium]